MVKKLNWGLIGGGEGSQIGEAHRIAAGLDGAFDFVASALDLDPTSGRDYAIRKGVPASRAYGDWREMLQSERGRDGRDRLDLITVATPNVTHYEISKAFLEAGFDVLCEKPLTTTIRDAEDLVTTARDANRILAVNYGYSGYPMIRQARAMVAARELGRVRVVVAEFAHGSHADAADADNPRIRWRYDPKQAGVSSVLADAGIHALHLACYVLDRRVRHVSADFVSCVGGRELEDDALLSLRFFGGEVGRLWTSAVALGQAHGLTLRVFGERGGLRWAQEHPNQLYWTPLGESTRTLERGDSRLSEAAARGSRVAIGHAEGLLSAFGNIYADLAEALRARAEGRVPKASELSYPSGEDGLHTLAVVHAAAASAQNGGKWVDL